MSVFRRSSKSCVGLILWARVRLRAIYIFKQCISCYYSQIHLDSLPGDANDNYLVGGGIVVAAMYRCVSGAVPPWAVEYVPSVLKSLYSCRGNDLEVFHTILVVGSELQLNGDYNSGCVRKTLAGHYYDTIKAKTKDDFLTKARNICIGSRHFHFHFHHYLHHLCLHEFNQSFLE